MYHSMLIFKFMLRILTITSFPIGTSRFIIGFCRVFMFIIWISWMRFLCSMDRIFTITWTAKWTFRSKFFLERKRIPIISDDTNFSSTDFFSRETNSNFLSVLSRMFRQRTIVLVQDWLKKNRFPLPSIIFINLPGRFDVF